MEATALAAIFSGKIWAWASMMRSFSKMRPLFSDFANFLRKNTILFDYYKRFPEKRQEARFTIA